MGIDWVLVAVVALALVFDFVNGFHDAANSIATVVSTRVLKPQWAVIWAAFFNFAAFLVTESKVAATIGKDTVQPTAITLAVVAAGLVGAIVWDLLTWWWGIPSSSSHALVGGLAGSAYAFGGLEVLKGDGLLRTGIGIIAAPLLGFAAGWVIMILTYWIFRKCTYTWVSKLFRRMQLVSAALYSLAHGGNDAQKTMGIILLALLTTGHLSASVHEPPLWVVLSCHAAIGLGTMFGGWRIVKTMGQKICDLQPVHGFAAETAGALFVMKATGIGVPVSTTHTITGAILGVGSTRGLRSVKWQVAGRVVWAWVLTIPASAIVAALTWYVFAACGWR